MRRFRFIGDPKEYSGDFQKEAIYDYSVLGASVSNIEMNVEWLFNEYTEDWQEVFDNDGGTIIKPLHKDTDLGYFSGLAMQGQFSQIDKYIDEYDEDWINPFIVRFTIILHILLIRLQISILGIITFG